MTVALLIALVAGYLTIGCLLDVVFVRQLPPGEVIDRGDRWLLVLWALIWPLVAVVLLGDLLIPPGHDDPPVALLAAAALALLLALAAQTVR